MERHAHARADGARVQQPAGAFPTLTLDADQWGEHGFFYDPVERRFGVYAIDRKCQTDEVETFESPEDLRRRCADEHRPALEEWLARCHPNG